LLFEIVALRFAKKTLHLTLPDDIVILLIMPMEICKKNKCTGCFACVNACPFGAISMKEDEYGELHPTINEAKCRRCYLCVKTCPNNFPLSFLQPKYCYASWITDSEKRKKCSSGGIATILSEYVISKGGKVFATAYNNDFIPEVQEIKELANVERFKGSKYCQSIVGDSYRQIKKYIQDGTLVSFIGTPCQVAGLKSFLGKEYQNLITIDLICHGVCPTKYFEEEIRYLSSKIKKHAITDIRFRGNDFANYCLSIWGKGEKEGKPTLLYIKPRYEQPYLAGFLLGITLRENCYTCDYSNPKRLGDITIGDFLRLGKTIPFPYKVKRTSVVLINSEKGSRFYTQMSEDLKEKLINIERDYSERLVYKPSLLHPFEKHPSANLFREKYLKLGFVKAIRSVLRTFFLKQKCKKLKNNLFNTTKKIAKSILMRHE